MIKCPYCGKSHYTVRYYTSTLMGWETIIKDGELVSKDPNIHTTHCTCLECGSDFSFNNKGNITKDAAKEVNPLGNKVCPKNCIGDCKECELIAKKVKAFDIIKGFVDFNVYEMQGKYYLTIGNNYRGQIPISKEEYDLLKGVLL